MAHFETQAERAKVSHHAKLARAVQAPLLDRNDADEIAAQPRTCVTCGERFELARGEVRFETAVGILYTRCKPCRPSRRAALAAGGVEP